jgi:uncharacterized protein YndB with AHSA1/START domain
MEGTMLRREFILVGGAALLSLAATRYSLAQASSAAPRDLIVTRVFDASIDQVWQAWIDPDLVMQWWGPDGFTSPLAEMDFREGGTSLVCMRSPDGTDMYTTWAYTRIVPLERFEYIFNLSDKDGNSLDPVALGLPPNFPRDARHAVVFKALAGNRTEMTMTEFGYTSDQLFDLSKAGLEQSLDKMVAIFANA